eukprot:gene401-6815_t
MEEDEDFKDTIDRNPIEKYPSTKRTYFEFSELENKPSKGNLEKKQKFSTEEDDDSSPNISPQHFEEPIEPLQRDESDSVRSSVDSNKSSNQSQKLFSPKILKMSQNVTTTKHDKMPLPSMRNESNEENMTNKVTKNRDTDSQEMEILPRKSIVTKTSTTLGDLMSKNIDKKSKEVQRSIEIRQDVRPQQPVNYFLIFGMFMISMLIYSIIYSQIMKSNEYTVHYRNENVIRNKDPTNDANKKDIMKLNETIIGLLKDRNDLNQQYIEQKKSIESNLALYKFSLYNRFDDLNKYFDDLNSKIKKINQKNSESKHEENAKLVERFNELKNEMRKIKEEQNKLSNQEYKVKVEKKEIPFGDFDFKKDLRNELLEMINQKLNQFSNDGGIGHDDFAINGGKILESSETYKPESGFLSILSVKPNPPKTILNSNIIPGNCWCLKGNQGFVSVEILYDIIPKAFTIDVPPIQISKFNSAPKEFEVYGASKQEKKKEILLGKWEIKYGQQIFQTFNIEKPIKQKMNIFRLKIKSNHGSPIATCIYRFRIHGKAIF